MSRHPQTWRVTWNKDLYDYIMMINDFREGDIEDDEFNQSKGNAKMVNVPKIGDKVYVSCDKLEIMKCLVVSNFTVGLDGDMIDIYDRGTNRPHTSNNTYLRMKIVEVYDDPLLLKGNQRTWTKYNGSRTDSQ